jgi:uncharacterized protein YyaL (SSP411 family)
MVAGFCVALLALVIGPSRADAPKPKDRPQRPSNRLARESSPYLLLHAHNPVDWYPWGPEAFAKAKKEGKLVFLSIGYSSCYWCHVMERESFSNLEVAKLLNQWFVCIKVDREERPDVDNIYMTSLQVMRQRGGWPLSMFLTADGKPIVGGTYWPREDREIEGRKVPGFKTILESVHNWHAGEPKEVQEQADTLARATTDALAWSFRGLALIDLKRDLVDSAIADVKEEVDPVYGGFGNRARRFQGTKFPVPTYLELLLHEAARTKSTDLLDAVDLTLEHMARGGIYDQVGGGFHRYSTERTWTVPHFEKMLYDNAQLVAVYARAYRQTKKPLYRRVVEETLAFVRREMTAPEGGFYSALDAETNGEEGRCYVWTDQELAAALPEADDAAFVKKVYGADSGVNFEDKYHILLLPKPLAETAKDLELSEQQVLARLTPLRQKLLEARSKRPRPLLDTKILAGWNGQMIAAYALAGQLLEEPSYTAAAARAAEFVLKHLRTKDGRLLRTYAAVPGKAPEARLNAYLDDYAYLADGLLCLHDTTGDKKWLAEARVLTDIMVQWHADKNGAGFFYTSNDHEKFFARAKDDHDSAQPSGNSIAARNLVQLWIKTGDARYRALAEKTFKGFAAPLKANPSSLTAMAHGLSMYLDAQEARGPGSPKTEPAAAQGGGTGSDSKVKVTATAGKLDADGKQVVTVTIRIEEGWHLYANPVPADFPGIPTTVTIEGKTKPQEVEVDYPPGKRIKDAAFGDYNVYEDKVVIKATVRRAKGDSGPLEARVKVQTCNDKKCLAPATVKVAVD